MAYKVAAVTGNWSTAGTWYSVPNTPTLHASTNITISTTNLFTATFTAPNLVDSVNGCLLYIIAPGTAGQTVTVTLQDNTVDTGATATLSFTDIKANSWVYFSFGTPYTFASLAAGRYRFKVVSSGSGSHTGAADSGAANLAYLATTDATGAPASTDYVFITSKNLGAAITVTMEGTRSIGNGADTASPSSTCTRSIGIAVQILYNGILSWDTATSATLTSLGSIISANGGEFRMGTVAVPLVSGVLARLIFNENGTSCNYGLIQMPSGKVTMQGIAKSSTSLWKTKYASGSGTAASPLITADAVDWVVGDEIVKGPSTNNAANYSEGESRFIITKNSSTSYVVSATKGGAESAFTNINTDSWLINVERNALIDTTNTAQSFYFCIQETADASLIQVKWARFETLGASTAIVKNGVIFATGDTFGNIDYSVAYRPLYRGFTWNGSTATQSHTGLVVYGQNSAAATYGIDIAGNAANKTFTDCFAINCNRGGIGIIASSCTFNRIYALGCNSANSASVAALTINSYNCTYNSIEVHANRLHGIWMRSNAENTFNSALVGTKGDNDIDVDIESGNFNKAYFISSSFSSATFVNGYSGMVDGSRIGFQNLSGTANNHVSYYKYGLLRSTGAGLADTTIRTSGSRGVRLAPENLANGLLWEFQIPAIALSTVFWKGYLQKNAAFGTDVCRVELWLPGSTSADATSTLSDTTGTWQSVLVNAYYSGTESKLATIKIYALSATASAYIFIDDMYDAGDGSSTTSNPIAGLDIWYLGIPATLIVSTVVDAGSVWNYPTAGLTTAGTTGKALVDTLIKTDDNQSLIIGM